MTTTTDRAVSVEDRLASCEGIVKTVARLVINRRNWLTAGGCDLEDVAQAGRMEVARLAKIYPHMTECNFRSVASIAVRRRMYDLTRNVGAQVGVRRNKGEGTGGCKGAADPSKWLRIDGVRGHFRYDGSSETDKFSTPVTRDPEHADSPAKEFRSFVKRLGGCLSATERDLLTWYYVDGLGMKKVGELLGLCESRVSQVHAGILAKLSQAEAGRIAEARAGVA